MFRVGQKVALVNSSGWDTELIARWSYPRKGAIYTVRDSFRDSDGEACIRLDEIINRVGLCLETGDLGEPFFAAHRFRPIVERKTDISIFTEMLRRESAPSSLPLAEA